MQRELSKGIFVEPLIVLYLLLMSEILWSFPVHPISLLFHQYFTDGLLLGRQRAELWEGSGDQRWSQGACILHFYNIRILCNIFTLLGKKKFWK